MTSVAGAVTAAEAWTTRNQYPLPSTSNIASTTAPAQPKRLHPHPRPKQPELF